MGTKDTSELISRWKPAGIILAQNKAVRMNKEFLRRKDESEYAYIYRIGSNKEQIGSWQDVADLINSQLGYEYTESKYRKDYNAFKKMFDANREHFIDTAEQLSAIEQRELDLKREARKFYDQRQALTRVVNA